MCPRLADSVAISSTAGNCVVEEAGFEVFESLSWIDAAIEELSGEQRLRKLRLRQSPHVAGMVQVDDRQLVDFGSNDYLGLSADARLVEAVRHSIGQVGWGAAASPLIHGRAILHGKLERRLAEFKRTEAALLFPTGFAANMGVVTSLVGKGDIVFSDEKNHASIIDGCRLSGAQIVIFRHCDPADLSRRLAEQKGEGKKLIVTDSVFSMDGDIAPLDALCEIAREYQAMLMVDEAHATGVFGKLGGGICEHFGVESDVPVRVGTLSKAIGSMGGFVVGDQKLIDWIANRARTLIYSTGQPEAVAAAAIRSLEIIENEPGTRVKLLETADQIRERVSALGFPTGNSASPIIPIQVGNSERALSFHQRLLNDSLFVPAIRYPTVAREDSMLRVSLTAMHTTDHLDRLIEALKSMSTEG